MVGCGNLSLYANESCDEHAIYFRIEMACHVNHFFDIWQWCNFTGIEALEFSCMYMLSLNFLLGLNFIFFFFELIIIHYHTQKQKKIKLKPGRKLNHNMYTRIACFIDVDTFYLFLNWFGTRASD